MEVQREIRDAITHAVRAVERRNDGLQSVADRHSAAAKAALFVVVKALALPSPGASHGGKDRHDVTVADLKRV